MVKQIRVTKGPEFNPDDLLPFLISPSGEKKIELTSLDIQVVITGLYAETTQTLTFFNPNHRDLEGELQFPMPDNATVCGYGLDIKGKIVDGVIVPKEEARQILDTEIRKGVDPGLLEQVAGNIYKTRIYPIPSQGTRTVRITYIQDLTVVGNEAAYHLPLGHASLIDHVALKIEVVQAPVQPEIGGIGNTTLHQWEDRWVAEATLEPQVSTDDLLVRLPNLPKEILCVEQCKAETFFAISKDQDQSANSTWKPKRIGIIWDSSGSRANDGHNHQRDFDLLHQFYDKYPSVAFDLLVFHNTIEPILHFDSATKLTDHLQAIPCDGSTCLNSLDLTTIGEDNDGCLLFSDGLNSGDHGLPTLGNKPIVTVNSQPKNNSGLLEYVAEQSNGIYINLLTTSPENALKSIGRLAAQEQITDCTGCEDLFMSHKNNRLTIVGKLIAQTATIRFSGLQNKSLKISKNATSKTANIARVWAGLKARKISLTDINSEEIITLGRTYGLVTPGTSLLVLESLAQYLEYDIEPPESQSELRAQFHAQNIETKKNTQEAFDNHFSQVLSWWEDRKKWWNTDFVSSYFAELKKKSRQQLPSSHGSLNGQTLDTPAFMRRSSAQHMIGEQHNIMMCESTPFEDSDENYALSDNLEIPSSDLPKSTQASITIQSWNPDTPYITKIQDAEIENQYDVYLSQRENYAASPSFFLDCGDFFLKHNQPDLGLRILSNLEELQLSEVSLLRIYAWRLQQAKQLDLAITIFERIVKIRDDEPQSHRDLALALSDRWQQNGNPDDALRAMSLLYTVITRAWDRFPEIELIALMELNRLISMSGQKGIVIPKQIDHRLVGNPNLDLDVRISMSWDADLTDVDLHVFEPDGGHAYYSNNRTLIGGLVSRDFVEGYGPEEYILHKAMPGKYIIKAHYFASHQQTTTGPCTVTVTVFTNYGRHNEQKQVLTLRLEEAKSDLIVGEIEIKGDAWHDEQMPADNSILQNCNSLKKDMSLNEVQAILGKPDKLSGDEALRLTYLLSGQSTIEISMNPKLEWIKHLMCGATRDII